MVDTTEFERWFNQTPYTHDLAQKNHEYVDNLCTLPHSIIKEAPENISQGARKDYPEVLRGKTARLRDVLIYGYFGII